MIRPSATRSTVMDRTDQQPDPPLDLVAEWLTRPISVEEVAEQSWPDPWLKDWFAMLARMEPGDELWAYEGWAADCPDGSPDPDPWGDCHVGFARVRDGRVVEHLPTGEHCY